jgi:hypothetical protein
MRTLGVDVSPQRRAEVPPGEYRPIRVEHRETLILLVLCRVLTLEREKIDTVRAADADLGLEDVIGCRRAAAVGHSGCVD